MFAAYIESTKLNSNFQFRILIPNIDLEYLYIRSICFILPLLGLDDSMDRN